MFPESSRRKREKAEHQGTTATQLSWRRAAIGLTRSVRGGLAPTAVSKGAASLGLAGNLSYQFRRRAKTSISGTPPPTAAGS
jgi:hypothetical protein